MIYLVKTMYERREERRGKEKWQEQLKGRERKKRMKEAVERRKKQGQQWKGKEKSREVRKVDERQKEHESKGEEGRTEEERKGKERKTHIKTMSHFNLFCLESGSAYHQPLSVYFLLHINKHAPPYIHYPLTNTHLSRANSALLS